MPEHELSTVIRELVETVKRENEDSPRRQLAIATSALPAYIDMGGAIALTVDGRFVLYDDESGITTNAEEPWVTVAKVKLAKRYDELHELMPKRPDDAEDCQDCQGAGALLESFDCGSCWGTGWRTRSK